MPVEVARSADHTRKLLFALERGRAVESVIIPDAPRLTVCISSQAGCAMGCTFCATAQLGLQRHLGAAEIAGQLIAVRAALDPDERLSNVVFMGMGEPLANYDNVVEAIEILTAPGGFNLSGRRITVSTVGLLPQLERLVRETGVSIAVSLTATTDALRDELMPVNRRYPLAQLFDTCRALPIAQRRRITFEYVMLAGVNDSVEHAHGLVSSCTASAPGKPHPFGLPRRLRAPAAGSRRPLQAPPPRFQHPRIRPRHRGRDIQAPAASSPRPGGAAAQVA
jgi:23S rRNA (adenine2503-C2)-methyltransferase